MVLVPVGAPRPWENHLNPSVLSFFYLGPSLHVLTSVYSASWPLSGFIAAGAVKGPVVIVEDLSFG